MKRNDRKFSRKYILSKFKIGVTKQRSLCSQKRIHTECFYGNFLEGTLIKKAHSITHKRLLLFTIKLLFFGLMGLYFVLIHGLGKL